MSVSSLACPTCGAALDSSATTTPTITCRYCGTVVKNPFFREGSASEPIPLPVINITITPPLSGTATPVPPPPPLAPPPLAPPPREEYYGVPYAPPRESPKNWTLTLLLCLFLGWIGAHRFYTGHYIIGLIQFFTLGGFGLWWIVDLVLILTGVYHDRQGLPLSGRHWSKRMTLGIGGVLLFGCIGCCASLYFIGQNATKVATPADYGWITGYERCESSPAYEKLILQQISVWEDWGNDPGDLIGTVAHGSRVRVLEARRTTGETVTYYRIQTERGLRGWVSEAFVQFQPVEEGSVPRRDC